MEDLKDRIKLVRNHFNLTQSEFGARVGVKGNTIGNYETDLRKPSEAVIFSICREFGVNEKWLRTGAGGEENMFIKLSAYDKAYNRFGYVMENASASKKAALTMLLELVYRTSDEEWDLIMKEIDEIKKGEV